MRSIDDCPTTLPGIDHVPPEFAAAGLSDAYREMIRLLRHGTESDLRIGPRWRQLSRYELADHCGGHLDSVRAAPDRYDRDSGCREAAHVAIRGLMLCQYGIEHDEPSEAAE